MFTLAAHESGFRNSYSTTTFLSCLLDNIIRATDEGLIVSLVLFDYSKAFDEIHHNLQCTKVLTFLVWFYLSIVF